MRFQFAVECHAGKMRADHRDHDAIAAEPVVMPGRQAVSGGAKRQIELAGEACA